MTDDPEWSDFQAALKHWGEAGRGLHGPKGLGRPGGAEHIPDWNPDDDLIEDIVTGVFAGDEQRRHCLVLYYVYGLDDFTSAHRMRVARDTFLRFRMETERLLYDCWRRRQYLTMR